MFRKSLIVSLLSFIIYFIPAFFIWYYKLNYKLGPKYFGASAGEFFAYCSPVIVITLVALLIFNSLFKRNIDNRSPSQNNKVYFILTGAFAVIMTLGFTLFDYFQFNRLGEDGDFFNLLMGYSQIFLFILIVLLMDRKIYFNNFK